MSILLVTTRRSEHASALEACLDSIDYSRLNTDSSSNDWPNYSIDSKGIVACSFIDSKGVKREISEFSSIWWDEVVPCRDNFENVLYPSWAFLETQKAMDWILSSLNAKYVNPPIAILNASNKVKQLQMASKLGLTIPDTLISSDFESVMERVKTPTIYKPISRPTSESVGDDRLILTSLIDNTHIIESSVSSKLSLFQSYISKKYEVRAYVIGDKCLSAEIHSQNSDKAWVDWRRYDFANTPHYVHDMPSSIQQKCIKLTNLLGLSYSAIDIIVTPEEDYVFVELNPQGLWLWIEKITGLPITSELAFHLMNT